MTEATATQYAEVRQLKDDETAVKEYTPDTESQSVLATFTTREKADAPRYVSKARLDFSKCTQEQILRLAADSVVILIQRNARKDAPDLKKGMVEALQGVAETDVSELLASSNRRQSNPKAQIEKLMNKYGLTREDVLEMLGDAEEETETAE